MRDIRTRTSAKTVMQLFYCGRCIIACCTPLTNAQI